MKKVQTKNNNDVKLKKANPKLTPSKQLTDREIQSEKSLHDSHQRITKEAKELTAKYKGTRNRSRLYNPKKHTLTKTSIPQDAQGFPKTSSLRPPQKAASLPSTPTKLKIIQPIPKPRTHTSMSLKSFSSIKNSQTELPNQENIPNFLPIIPEEVEN